MTDPKVIENWIYEMNYDTLLPLIALNDGHIVRGRRVRSEPHRLDQTSGGTASDHLHPVPGQGAGNYVVAKPHLIATHWAWSSLALKSHRLDKAFTCLKRWDLRKWPICRVL